MNRVIVGGFESISLPKLGLRGVIAKVDTGAYSGAVHCTDIKIVRRGLIRKRYLKFTPDGNPDLATETDVFKLRFVRSATGHRVKRYVIETVIEVQGSEYPIWIGLSDRTDLKRPVLLGRRFLYEHNMLVDVRLNREYDDEGENIQ